MLSFVMDGVKGGAWHRRFTRRRLFYDWFFQVVCWVLASGLISYARLWIYGFARVDGARGMRAVGAVGQVGSAIGSLTLFLIVNFANVFEQNETCPTPD